MDIRWLVSVDASSLHAARQVLRGGLLVDTVLAEKHSQPLDQLRSADEAWQIDPIVLVEHLTAASVESSSCDQQVRLAIRKVAGESSVPRMAAAVTGWIQQMLGIFLQVHPRALEELQLRSDPLRQQWDARGPGLMARLRSFLGPEPLVESADVILVQPVMGGGGEAFVPYNRVSFEAVLANPVDELPEVIRLGWLLAQLQLDLPTIQGQLSRQRTLEVGAWAAVPAILAAAHDVELSGPVEIALPKALAAWRLPAADADTLLAWWETYLADCPPWGIGLAALDQMRAEKQN